MEDLIKTDIQNNKEYIIYINTGFVIDYIVCRGYSNIEAAINDLRNKFENESKNFICTKQDYLDFKKSKKKA